MIAYFHNNKWLCATAIVLFILVVMGSSYAQKFTASVNKNKVEPGETFKLDYTINAMGKNFTPPSLNDFNVYSGPNQSSSMTIVNGNVSQSLTFTYYLSAKKEGKFTIEPAMIQVGGNTFQSNSITIEVVKGSSSQQTQNYQGTTGVPSSTENLFVRTSVSKTKAYMGEQITLTHKVYTRMNLKGFQDAKFPSFNGFWVQDSDKPKQYEITHENIDGITYNVVEIKRAFLFPQRTGKLHIEPVKVDCIVREKTGKRYDPFEQFFGYDPFFSFDTYKDALYSIKSNDLTIEVLPLPENNKPANFSGAVGNFSLHIGIDKEKVKENEGVNLKITITGRGNIKLIDAPKIDFPVEFETYEPKTNETISTAPSGISGTKTFEYLFIPRHEGFYKIKPNDFSYFDPEKKTYVSLPSKEFSITVEKEEGSAAGRNPMIPSVAKEDVKVLNSDIRFIKTNFSIKKKDKFFFNSPLFIAGFSVPPLLFLAFLIARREHIRRNSDLVAVRRRKASSIAKKYLSIAEKLMKKNDKENFFMNVLAALYNYLGNKMNIPASQQSRERVVDALKEKNIPDEIIHELIKLMDECEFVRYAPSLQSGNLEEVYTRAETIINKIENSLS